MRVAHQFVLLTRRVIEIPSRPAYDGHYWLVADAVLGDAGGGGGDGVHWGLLHRSLDWVGGV